MTDFGVIISDNHIDQFFHRRIDFEDMKAITMSTKSNSIQFVIHSLEKGHDPMLEC